MGITGCTRIGTIIRPYVDERDRWNTPQARGTAVTRPGKAEMARLYVRAARRLGHSQVDQRFHLELIRLTKPADYAEGRAVMLAHSNSFLEVRCGMSRSAIGRQLRKHDGATLTRTLSGNGHRFVARRSAPNNDGAIVEACGISLEPLVAMLAGMVPVLAAEDELQTRLEITKACIGRDRRRQRTAIAMLDAGAATGSAKAAANLEAESRALATGAAAAFKAGRLSELETIACRVGVIANEIEDIVSQSAPPEVHDRTPQVSAGGHLLPLQYPQIIDSVVATEKTENVTPAPAHQEGQARSAATWTPQQLKTAFPGLAMYVPAAEPFWADIENGSTRLAKDLGINGGSWVKAREAMGLEQRCVAIGLVAELLTAGRVKTTPGQYFGGMLNKARRGDLDLGRSVWAHNQRSKTASRI